MTENHIVDQSGDRKYFTMIPNILWVKDLTSLERWLYATIKKVAGDDGECFMGTPTLAKESGMSAGSISKAKQTLQSRGLIKISRRKRSAKGRAVDHITITDIWEENMLHFLNRSADERKRSADELKRSADETEEELIKKNPEENNIALSRPIAPSAPEPEPIPEPEPTPKPTPTPKSTLTEGQQFYLDTWRRKRFANRIQRDAFAECEREVGTAKLKNAITWAARNGINRVDSILTAARGNGKPKKHKQRSPQEPDGDGMNATQRRRAKQYPVADANDPDIKRWLEEQELERQKEAASD